MTAFGERGFRRNTSKSVGIILKKVLTNSVVCGIIIVSRGGDGKNDLARYRPVVATTEKNKKFLKNFSKTP